MPSGSHLHAGRSRGQQRFPHLWKSSHLGLWETTSHKLTKLSILLINSARPPITLLLTHTFKHRGDPWSHLRAWFCHVSCGEGRRCSLVMLQAHFFSFYCCNPFLLCLAELSTSELTFRIYLLFWPILNFSLDLPNHTPACPWPIEECFLCSGEF